MSKQTVLEDVYVGLRELGYTRLAAITALRTLGVEFRDAKDISDEAEASKSTRGQCPSCERTRALSDAPESGVTFKAALCTECRDKALRGLQGDDFDRAYAKAVANGWAD